MFRVRVCWVRVRVSCAEGFRVSFLWLVLGLGLVLQKGFSIRDRVSVSCVEGF